jgi:hypothetical protein
MMKLFEIIKIKKNYFQLLQVIVVIFLFFIFFVGISINGNSNVLLVILAWVLLYIVL